MNPSLDSTEADPETGSASVLSDATSAAYRTGDPVVVLVRHGQTEWSASGRHTGDTDVPLTPVGEQQARSAGNLVRALLGSAQPAAVISSPRQRALHTAELAGFPPTEITEDAAEWDYGDFEGMTTDEIRRVQPDWTIWSGPVPGGEDATTVSHRIDRLLKDVVELAAAGPVLVFSHGHASRCVAARWLGEPVTTGQQYWLNTGAVSALGYEHQRRVVLRWNLDSSVVPRESDSRA